ncbi:DMT family transporter [Pseudooceanicola onchidii]|uniref:DMT family transporter n=1 Tax=Pseudooceanicola onchidii TaxID=2562279 RepID=UPI001F0DDA25|nr:DMT family transporter [Pseudooceanicola onchidii]
MTQKNRAIVYMIGAIFFFTCMDALAKGINLRSGPAMALWARYTGQMVFVLILVAPRLKTVARTKYPGFQFLRSMFLFGATASFFTGLGYMGLAEITAIMDINPVLITLGAAIFLGEALGPRRILGIVVAMIGAMIIIRPGTGVFSWTAIFPLMAAVCYSAYSLATRHIGNREDPWTSLLYAALLGSVVTSGIVVWNWQTPDLVALLLMLGLAMVGTIGQLSFIRAFTEGEAAMLAPFAYTGLIFATLWGALIYDEYPDLWTVVGAIVVVGAGLYVWYRETKTAPAVAEAKGQDPV